MDLNRENTKNIDVYRKQSEAQSSAESRSFDVIMNVLVFDWLLDDLPSAEGYVSGGVKVSWSLVEGPVDGLPSFNFTQLD